jgi:hypothetical protein
MLNYSVKIRNRATKRGAKEKKRKEIWGSEILPGGVKKLASKNSDCKLARSIIADQCLITYLQKLFKAG